MRKILSLFAAVLFAFAVNAQGTDFAAPGYSCAADDAVLTGGSSSNFFLKTDVTPHCVAWSDVSLSSNAVATWTVTATRGCYVSVSLDLGPVIGSNKHNFVVKILDNKGNVKGSVTEGGENTASEQVKLLADSILVPAAGTYTVEVVNNRDWGKGTIKNVILTYVADAPSEMIPVSSIVINKQSLGLELNEVELLTATVAPDNAFDPSVTWQSSDPTVATVSETGLVAAVAAGTANIIAKAGEKLDTCVVTVAAATVPSTDFTEPFVLSGKKARLEGAIWKNDAYKLYGDGGHNKNYGNAFWTLNVNKRCIVSATLNGVEGGHEFVLDVFKANGDSITTLKQPEGKTWSAGEIALDTTIAFAAKGEYTFRLRNTQEWSSGKVAGITLTFVEEMDPTASVYGTMTNPAWEQEIKFTLAQDKKSATLTVPSIAKGEYQFKMVINGEWRSNGYTYHRGFPAAGGISGNVDNNMILKTDVDGEYSFTWTFANDSLSIIYPEKPANVLENGYYLVGTQINAWKPAAKYLFVANPGAEGEYMLTANMIEGDSIKVVKVVDDEITTWYPAGANFVITAAYAGEKTIYFKPDYNSAWADFGGNFYMEKNKEIDPYEPYVLTFCYFDSVSADSPAKLTTIEGIFDKESQPYIAKVDTGINVYAGRYYKVGNDTVFSNLKLGTSSKIGELKFILKNVVEVDSVVFNAAMYADNEGGDGFKVNGVNFPLSAGKLKFEECVWKPEGKVDTIYIVQNKAAKGRFFLTSIAVYPKAKPSAVPTVAAPAPTWPAKQVKSLYSDAYTFAPESLNSYNEAWWDRPSMAEEEISGDKYLHYNGLMTGMIGWQFGEINVSNMEYIHVDVWPSANTTIKMGPTTPNDHGNAVAKVALTVETGKWNAIDIPVADLLAANAEFSLAQVFQNQFTEYAALTDLSIDNVYFYTTVAPAVDTVAPTAFTAVMDAASYFSVNIKANATDNSGAVEFDVLNGELIIASAKAVSATDKIITVAGLTPNTDYNFSVIAKDEDGNATAPIAVAAKTLAAPAPAPAPTAAADDVKSIYSDAYDFAPDTLNSYNEGWWNAPVMVEGQLAEGDNALFYAAATTGMIGWQFGEMDLTAYAELHIDIYPIADGSILIYPVNNTDPKGEYKDTYNVKGGQWNSLVIDLSGKDLTKIFQIAWIDYYALNGFFIDNVYFAKKAEPVAAPYYLVGTMTEWKPAEAYQFVANPATAGEYMLETTLTVGDKFKVAKSENGETIADSDWYPGGMGNDYVVDAAHAGAVTIYFRPDGQGGEGWYEGYFYVSAGEGFENLFVEGKAVKVLHNGQIYILKNNKVYTVMGQPVE